MFLLSSCFNNDIAHNIIRSNWQRRKATSTPVRPSLLSCYREKAKFQILDTLQNAACRPSAGEILLSSLLFYCIWIRICFSVILCTILPLHCLLLFITILHTTLGTIADKTSKQTSNQTSKNKYTTLQKVHIRLTTEYSKQVINLIHTQRQIGVAKFPWLLARVSWKRGNILFDPRIRRCMRLPFGLVCCCLCVWCALTAESLAHTFRKPGVDNRDEISKRKWDFLFPKLLSNKKRRM